MAAKRPIRELAEDEFVALVAKGVMQGLAETNRQLAQLQAALNTAVKPRLITQPTGVTQVEQPATEVIIEPTTEIEIYEIQAQQANVIAPLFTVSTPNRYATIQAPPTNQNVIYLGNSRLTQATGYPLSPGDIRTTYIDDLSKWWYLPLTVGDRLKVLVER
ncbi:MAG: hypothetical protein QXP58_06960 [Thermoprotei archaeon]